MGSALEYKQKKMYEKPKSTRGKDWSAITEEAKASSQLDSTDNY